MLAAGCAHWPKGTPAGQDADANAIAQALAKQHGVTVRPLAVELLDQPAFRARVAEQAKQDDTKGLADEARAWRALGLVHGDIDLAATLRDVMVEQIAAYYDPRRHVLVVPKSQRDTSQFDTRQVMAHEVEHALQDQRFGFPKLDRLEEDEALARRAVYESDGVLAMIVDVAVQRGLELGPTLTRFGAQLQHLPLSALSTLSGGTSNKLDTAPLRLRQLVVFPYFGALNLLVDLFRTGGFQLSDQLFSHPPESTEQLLHPDKYRAGERPIEVDKPHAPHGWHASGDGVLGELGVRAVLTECLGAERANTVAQGWGGDRFVALRGSVPAPGLLWSTVWDDEAHAIAFEAAMREVQACWRTSDPTLADGVTIERLAARVAVSRGPTGQSQALFALVHPRRPDRPPLGAIAPTPALPEPVEAPAATLEDDGYGTRYVDDWLGAEALVPGGFEASVSQPGLRLAMRGPVGFALVSVVQARYETKMAEEFLKSAGTALGRKLPPGATLAPDETVLPEIDLGWAHGLRRGWTIDGMGKGMRSIVAPLCGGKLALGVVFAGTDAGLEALTEWLRSLSFRTGVHPACETR